MSDDNKETIVDMSVKKVDNKPLDKQTVQVFVNTGAPVLLADNGVVPINTRWMCIGATTDSIVLRPVTPIEGQNKNMAVTVTPSILNMVFTVEEVIQQEPNE